MNFLYESFNTPILQLSTNKIIVITLTMSIAGMIARLLVKSIAEIYKNK